MSKLHPFFILGRRYQPANGGIITILALEMYNIFDIKLYFGQVLLQT